MADDLICLGDEIEYATLNDKKSESDSSSTSEDEEIVPVKKKRGATRRGLAKRLAQKNEATVETDEIKEENIYTSSLFNPENWENDYKEAELKLAEDSDVEEDIASIFTKKTSPKLIKQLSGLKSSKQKVEVDKNQNTERCETFIVESDEDDVEDCSQNTSGRRSPTPPPTEASLSKTTKVRKMKGITQTMKGLTRASLRYKESEENMADVSIVDVTLSPEVTTKDIMMKVRSRSGIQRFPMKNDETFHRVFKEMACHECVKLEQVVMFFGDHTVRPYDSPGSLNVTVADIIDCHIRKKEECDGKDLYSEDVLYPLDDHDVISLTVQGKDPKTRRVIRMRMHETMERVMQKFSSEVKVPLSNLTFNFDGEEVRCSDLASELELEDGYTIDVTGV